MNQESSIDVSDDFVNPLNLIDQTHRQYEGKQIRFFDVSLQFNN